VGREKKKDPPLHNEKGEGGDRKEARKKRKKNHVTRPGRADVNFQRGEGKRFGKALKVAAVKTSVVGTR